MTPPWLPVIHGEAALKKGHVSAARLLAGDHGQWQGLLLLGGSSKTVVMTMPGDEEQRVTLPEA